jgi:hypothetical protein
MFRSRRRKLYEAKRTRVKPEATQEQWDEYLENVRSQFSFLDRLRPENGKALIWDQGFDAVRVRRMLVEQKRQDHASARGLRS